MSILAAHQRHLDNFESTDAQMTRGPTKSASPVGGSQSQFLELPRVIPMGAMGLRAMGTGVTSTSSGLGLTLGSAAAVGLGHVIYCSWPRSPHLYNGNNDGGNNSTGVAVRSKRVNMQQ